jgi:hypothetical protein
MRWGFALLAMPEALARHFGVTIEAVSRRSAP